MENLKNEVNEMLELFDYFQIPEDKQRYIITSGVYFDFNRNDSVTFNCFRFAKLLKLCKSIDVKFDVNQMLSDLNSRKDSDYEHLVKLYIDMETKTKKRVKEQD